MKGNIIAAFLVIFFGFLLVEVALGRTKFKGLGVVTAAAHSELRWDSFLYKHAWLNPVAWMIERTISTPATHFAHHALHDNLNDKEIHHEHSAAQ